MRSRVFIGSSSENLYIAEEIQQKLSHVANVSVWSDNVFRPSEYSLESLYRQLDSTDYAIFVLGSDDIVTSRNSQGYIPRDNVLYELGLFSGRLGIKKVFMVQPADENLKLPTDLLGVSTLRYTLREDESVTSNLAPVCSKLKNVFDNENTDRFISWPEYMEHINTLIGQLKKTSGRGGFSFDTCVGVSRGGIIAADLIARHYGMNIPVICLWADLHSKFPQTTFSEPENWINRHVVQLLSEESTKNILLVNDISRSGVSVEMAYDYLKENLPFKNVRCAALITDHTKFDHIDFYAVKYDTKNLQLPYYSLG